MDFYGGVGYGKCLYCGKEGSLFQVENEDIPDTLALEKNTYMILQLCKACCEKQEKEYERARMFFSMGKALIELNDALGFEKENEE